MLKVCIFIIIHLCTSSSRNYTQMSKCPIPGNGLKTFKCTCVLSQRADAFMHKFEWIYLGHDSEYHIFTCTSTFYAFFGTLWYNKKSELMLTRRTTASV